MRPKVCDETVLVTATNTVIVLSAACKSTREYGIKVSFTYKDFMTGCFMQGPFHFGFFKEKASGSQSSPKPCVRVRQREREVCACARLRRDKLSPAEVLAS